MPITDTSWVVLRHTHTFLPVPWRTVVCLRDLKVEVQPGIKERRALFALDAFTGEKWHREGTGKYQYWSDIPPIDRWCPQAVLPPYGRLCLFWLHKTQHIGLQIGRVIPLDAYTNIWQVRERYNNAWVPIISTGVEGWILLPADAG